MSSSNQISDDKIKCNDGSPGRLGHRTLKLFSPKFKLESLLKPELFKITDKTIVLAKMKNSRGKPSVSYAYKVQKQVNFGRKKPKSPRILKQTSKSRKPKECKDILDEDFLASANDADLTPRNKDEDAITQNSYETATQNVDDFDFDFESSDDIKTSVDIESIDDFGIWHSVQGEVILSMVSKRTKPNSSEYVYLKNQYTMDAPWKKSNDKKQEKQIDDSSQNTELIRYDTKTFRSQQTSTSDLFKFRKLSPFARTILQKCHELEEMQFNSTGSSSQAISMGGNIPQPHFPALPEKTAQEGTMKMSQDYSSDKKLCVYENNREDLLPALEQNSNSGWDWFNPFNILTIISLLLLIVEIIYIRFQLRLYGRPPFWRRSFNNFANLIYFS